MSKLLERFVARPLHNFFAVLLPFLQSDFRPNPVDGNCCSACPYWYSGGGGHWGHHIAALVLLDLSAGLRKCCCWWPSSQPTESPRLQSVLNTAARMIAGLCSRITDTLASLHMLRLRAPERIKTKLAILVYRTLHVTAPRYLTDLLCPDWSILTIEVVYGRRQLIARPSRSVRHFRLPARGSATVHPATSHLLQHCQLSVVNWKLTSSDNLIRTSFRSCCSGP